MFLLYYQYILEVFESRPVIRSGKLNNIDVLSSNAWACFCKYALILIMDVRQKERNSMDVYTRNVFSKLDYTIWSQIYI